MGVIHGSNDAKSALEPADASLHIVMGAHGPDEAIHIKPSSPELKPTQVGDGGMTCFRAAFMLGVTGWGLLKDTKLQKSYNEETWEALKARFQRPRMD